MFEDGSLRSPGDVEAGLEAVEAVTLGKVRVAHNNVRTLSACEQVSWPTSEFMRPEEEKNKGMPNVEDDTKIMSLNFIYVLSYDLDINEFSIPNDGELIF